MSDEFALHVILLPLSLLRGQASGQLSRIELRDVFFVCG